MPVLTVNNQSPDDAEIKRVVTEEERGSFNVYSFGGENRDKLPEASGRLGRFFEKSSRMGHYMAREGWSTFNDMVRSVGEHVQETAMKITSTRAGSLALGVAGGLGLLALYKMAPQGGVISDLAGGAGGALTVASGVLAGHRGIAHGAAGANASEEIMDDRARGWGGDNAEWSDYRTLKDKHLDSDFLSSDHPEHPAYYGPDSEGKSWLTQSASFFGKAQIPMAAASIAMWGTSPKGALIAAGVALGPELIGRGIGAANSAYHLARDGFRELGERIDAAREGKDVSFEDQISPHGSHSGSLGGGATGGDSHVSFEMEEDEEEELEKKKKREFELRMKKPGDPENIA